MTPGSVPRRASHVAWTTVDDQVYVVAPAGPMPFTVVGLSATGSSIWRALDGVASVSTIAADIAHEWGLDPHEVSETVLMFLRDLSKAHVVEDTRP